MTGRARAVVVAPAFALAAAVPAGCARAGAGHRGADGIVRTDGCAVATSPPATSIDMPYWRDKGLEINTVGLRFDQGCVEVGTTDVERPTRELAHRYGTGIPITVVYQEPLVG